jgi:peptide/nickel transport system substrate-binding protein
MHLTKRLSPLALATLLVLALPFAARAAEVRIAVGSDPDSMDPQFHQYEPTEAAGRHVFDALTMQDAHMALHPGLAVSWKPLADDLWEFKLRPGVTFHDGTPFTADDVVFSVLRAPHVPNSPSSFAMLVKDITDIRATDPLTVQMRTNGPAPMLPYQLCMIAILSRHAAEGKTNADFNHGTATIGTGPYKFVEWVPSDHFTYARNPNYWGAKEPWDRVTFKPIANDGARVAALLSGDVDLIEDVPVNDRQRLASDKKVSLFETNSIRLMYALFDVARDRSPGITDTAGKPMDRNPLKDVRVRQAISHAINRQALVDRLLQGQGKPAGDVVPAGAFGANPALKPTTYDPKLASSLMEQAGWKNGFGLTIAGSNDRYPKDAEVSQAIAQMLSRIGIKTQVDSMPAGILYSRGSKLDFSMMIASWSADSSGAPSSLLSLLATYDTAKGTGPSNRARYSSPEFDRTLDLAMHTMDDKKREALLGQATAIGMNDAALLPLYFLVNTWAARKGLVYEPRTDEMTLAMGLRPAK